MSPSRCAANVCPPSRCPQQQRQIKMQVQKGLWLLLSTEGLKSQNVSWPEQTSVSYIAMRSKWLVVTEISISERHGCSSFACFKTDTAAWCSSETELGYFHCLMVSLVPLGCSCSSSLSQWSIGCALATLTHRFILRLPHALMTTLWGFGAYDIVLRKRNRYPEKPTWWAGSLRRNQKNNMEQVRPLSSVTQLLNFVCSLYQEKPLACLNGLLRFFLY